MMYVAASSEASAGAEVRPQHRPYQVRGLGLTRAEFARGRRSVAMIAPTGAGKTVMFCAMVRGHLERGGRVLIVAHRRELIAQAVARLHREGITDVGIILAGVEPRPEARVQVASVQTLLACSDLPDASLVVLDEAHHHVAEKWGQVAAHYANAKIVGVTATPQRSDGTALGDIFDALVVVATVRELTEQGYLVPCAVVAPTRKRRTLAGDPVVLWQEHAAGRPTVFFTGSVAESRELADRLRLSGVAAAHVDGDTPTDERDATLAAFARGEILALCNVFVLTEGWDAPRAEVCVLARGCSSVGTYLQMVGRVLRPSPETGKTGALLIDLRGVVHEHGLPDEDRVFSLEGRAIGRGPTRTCPECEAEIPLAVRVCPVCSAEMPASTDATCETAEKLTRVERAALERSYFAEQLDLARRRGYRAGWAAHRFQEKFGRFPRALWRELVGAARAA